MHLPAKVTRESSRIIACWGEEYYQITMPECKVKDTSYNLKWNTIFDVSAKFYDIF